MNSIVKSLEASITKVAKTDTPCFASHFETLN